jgi:hypothetical protein
MLKNMIVWLAIAAIVAALGTHPRVNVMGLGITRAQVEMVLGPPSQGAFCGGGGYYRYYFLLLEVRFTHDDVVYGFALWPWN